MGIIPRSVLFNHTWRYESFVRNPIKLVRQSANRRAAPNVLIPGEISSIGSGSFASRLPGS
jgi:hypothetical protein